MGDSDKGTTEPGHAWRSRKPFSHSQEAMGDPTPLLANLDIGERFGGIEAAAASHACRWISEALGADAWLTQRVRDLEAQLRPKIMD